MNKHVVSFCKMCADFCNVEFEDAFEYGFDVVSVVEQRSISGLTDCQVEILPKTLEAGVVICLTASTLPNCQSWSVNLLCGKTHSADIAFHFNPRLLQHYVARNTRLKGQWGHEESLSIGKFQIKQGEEFTLKIYVADDQFFVTYNETHVCSYEFRIPPSHVNHIEVCGMVDIYKIDMEIFEEYPEDRNGVYDVKEIDRSVARSIRGNENMEIPVRGFLPEGLLGDWQLEIYGAPKILPQSFSISLKNDLVIWPPCTIALHITANFGNNMLVRNAFIDNKWGTEERIGGFKFLPAAPFSLWIRRCTRKFSIWINEKLQADFGYRCDPDIVKAILIQGDVDVTGIYMNKNPEEYFRTS